MRTEWNFEDVVSPRPPADAASPAWSVERPGPDAHHNAVVGWLLLPDDTITHADAVTAEGASSPLWVGLPSPDVAEHYPTVAGARFARFHGFVPWEPGARSRSTFRLVFHAERRGEVVLGPFAMQADEWFVSVVADDPVAMLSRGTCALRLWSAVQLERAPRVEGLREQRTTLAWTRTPSGRGDVWTTWLPFGQWSHRTGTQPTSVVAQIGRRLVREPLPLEPGPSLPAAAAALGHPHFAHAAPVALPVHTTTRPSSHRPLPRAGGGGTCVVTVCTRDHLHFATVMARSVRAHHPELPVVIVVADARAPETVDVEDTYTVPATDLGVDRFPYLALKYSATDLCCALKPAAIQHAARDLGFERVVYLDADIRLYARMDALLDALDRADVVGVPHTLAPMPNPERLWERPSLGDLAYAGVLNAGLFAMTIGPGTMRFLEQWEQLVTREGAFLVSQGGQMEQNAFNWVIAFADRVHILRDPAYDVAYWNLHDRSVRWAGLDGGSGWQVDGQPLVAFHFSGFSPFDPTTLSRHQNRYSLHLLPSLARLFESYAEELLAAGAAERTHLGYAFDRFSSGIPIECRMRDVFKEHEEFLYRDIDPWTPEGERWYCHALLSPVPYAGSILPVLFESIYRDRADLQLGYADAPLHPRGFLVWVLRHGLSEYGYEALFCRHRPTLPTRALLQRVARARIDTPALLADMAAPLGDDVLTLVARAGTSGHSALADELTSLDGEHVLLSPMQLIRDVWKSHADLREAYPDPLFTQVEQFAHWLDTFGVTVHGLPAHLGDVLRQRGNGRVLARVFSYLNRDWHLMERYPLCLVGVGSQEIARLLLGATRHGLEYDCDDILAYLWVMEERPWMGIELTLELGVNLCRPCSSRLPEGQDQLLAPLLAGDDRFRQALLAYRRRRCDDDESRREQAYIRATARRGQRSVWPDRRIDPLTAPPRREGTTAALPGPSTRGVNLFGYFRSPIGLGSMTRGLAKALRGAGIAVAESIVGNIAMDADLRPEDFIGRWNWRYDTNLFVSYPHLREHLLHALPEYMVRDRRNVAYLAWEQRDAMHWWRDAYRDFDQVWALSAFAATSLSTVLERPVLDVPCVVDVEAFPPPATKADWGFPESACVFLYVFDANSSIERKNPEAALEAFAAAFGGRRDVLLVMKASNAQRLAHRTRLRALALRAEQLGCNVRFLTRRLSTPDILRLISSVDCYVSLHRSEGFGYTCAEAMAYARPVIATGYSGNLDFMSADDAFLVTADETPVTVADGPFQRGSVWAEPRIAHAAALMTQVQADPERARIVGLRGRETVLRLLSPEAVGTRVARALDG
ncbi:MAG TPA: glycosyltransferase [Candidatus Binatia bacterium]|jgi:glycosyltransferase involved in cell wall biosynthesis|nr:glycosyltransferase [Candidatus Binatia bacterium]